MIAHILPHLGWVEQRTCKRQQLLLAGRQRRAPLLQLVVQPASKRLNHWGQVGAPQRRPKFVVAVPAEWRQVGANAAGEQHGNLRAEKQTATL